MAGTEDPIGPPDASVYPRFAGIATFARLPRLDDVGSTDIAVVGVPFDSGVSYRPGARFGPAHVRESSRLLRPFNPVQDVEPFARQQVVDAGDIAVNPFNIEEAVRQIEDGARALSVNGTRLVSVGGDHTIALPLLRNVARQHGPVAVLHFDAHLDTWDTYFGAPMTHGTPFRRASEEGLLDLEACLHVGTRGRFTDAPISPTTSGSGLPSSAATNSRRRALPGSSSGCTSGSVIGRSMCLWTSTCSTRHTHPAPGHRRPAG